MDSKEIREIEWNKCKQVRDCEGWTIGDVSTYRGFFNLGYQAAFSTLDPEAIRQALDVSSDCIRIVLGAVDKQLQEALTKSLECHDEIYAILSAEPAQDDGKADGKDDAR